MRVFGQHFSSWWLLLLLPIGLFGLPSLVGLFFAANLFAGAILGPLAIWEIPWTTPARSELVGRYIESERHLDREAPGPAATVELHQDGTMRVDALPDDLQPGFCTLTGIGTWIAPSSDTELLLHVAAAEKGPHRCESSTYPIEVTGHWAPHGLYRVAGDPDSGTGIRFRRQ